jgi:methylthioribose-1-phosphate isomerase
MIRTILWVDDAVVLIDQKALPGKVRYLTLTDWRDVVAAIKDLTIRGAPAIGVAAAMGIALGTLRLPDSSAREFCNAFEGLCKAFAQARPTARNLFWAIERMQRRFTETLPTGVAAVKKALVEEAVAIGEEDIEINRRIGLNGKAFIRDGDNILTHCNAGALATAGYGTALGVVRAAREDGKKLHVYADETRPVLQGARLTCWELLEDRIPTTLITDNMAGFVMAQGKVNLVIVGADRIAGNGDTANKIGTYSLAILAREHGIPFYVAAPLSTIDRSIADGSGIPIEERHPDEVKHLHGVRTAPEKVAVYNPAFDVTPHRYITAIITEAGIAKRPFGTSLARLFKQARSTSPGLFS